jgi:hypothetical protein
VQHAAYAQMRERLPQIKRLIDEAPPGAATVTSASQDTVSVRGPRCSPL